MAKYNFEFKKKLVEEYLRGKGGYGSICQKNNIPNKGILQRWVASYKEFGDEGLVRSRKNKKYPFEFKLNVVELYLTTEVSYQELALSVGINNPPIIGKWVNDFRIAGPDALREKSKGRRPKMAKPKKTDQIDDNGAYLKQLEDDNLKLRIEVAYLKELRRLRLEEEALNIKRELSIASEENSN